MEGLIDEQDMEKAFMSRLYVQPAHKPELVQQHYKFYCFYMCVLLTCLGILCKRIDEVQNTWR